MRFITVILLLAVCFFGGMMYGTFEKNSAQVEVDVAENQVPTPPTVDEQDIIHELEVVNDQEYLVNKTASLFEKIVSSVYEGVINIMYKIANIFFG